VELTVFHHLAIALGLGLLVGLEREWAANKVAGIRTFPMITLLGAVCALLAGSFNGWILAAGFIGVASLLVVGETVRGYRTEGGPGITTEVAALVMFLVGAAVAGGYTAPGVVVGGIVAVLLHWKDPLHAFVRRIGESEFSAIVRLVVVALVILPVLPNRTFGPYGVLNPFQIWLMVVLIVSISLGAYTVYRLLGAKVGTPLSGILGGLISSTATTVSYARMTRGAPEMATTAAVVIILASTVVFVRVLFEIQIVAPDILAEIAPPLLALMGFMAVLAAVSFGLARGDLKELPERDAPSDLRAAIVFGLLYAAVLFGVAAAKTHFGEGATYVVAAISGLADMDAITLSTAHFVQAGELDVDTGWRLIMVGALGNLVFKAVAIAMLGHPRLALRVGVMFGITLVAGVLLLLFWPTNGA
jgi:uncharacterized membrane protein (DUF4010 family)